MYRLPIIALVVTVPVAFAESPAGLPATQPATQPSGPTAAYDALLKQHVDARGMVDYRALHRSPKSLKRYVDGLAAVDLDALPRDGKLATLINAYNAFTLQLIVEHWPVDSIMDIPEDKRWEHRRWDLGGRKYSLNEIEHQVIRKRFDEPRIHFVLVCAAVGCPPLRREAYVDDRLDAQLADQTRYVHDHETWYRFDRRRGVLHLTKLYDWYAGDFTPKTDGVLDYVARYDPHLRQALAADRDLKIAWIEYDWALNARKARREEGT